MPLWREALASRFSNTALRLKVDARARDAVGTMSLHILGRFACSMQQLEAENIAWEILLMGLPKNLVRSSR